LVDTGIARTTMTLEDRLFEKSIYLGFIGIALLLIFDVFFTGDYLSIFAECFALLFFAYNLRILIKRKSSGRHRFVFSMVLLIIINFGWLTGGGMSLLLAALFFLAMEFILVVNDARHYRVIILILSINYIILFCAEYFFQFNLSPEYESQKGSIIKQFIIVFLLLLFGGYFTIFLKVKYNSERTNLHQANTLLKEKSKEITDQNEELKTSKVVLDKTIAKLDNQKDELMQIKGSLENKIRERTNDLLKMNERLLSQNQQLEQYAYITSHNLRAPITQIKGLVHLLPKNEDFDEVTKETLNRLEGSIQSIERVFSDLSTILNVKNSMQKRWELVDIIREIVVVTESLQPSIKEKKINIGMPSHTSFTIKALRPYVYSILHNLIENAVKYSDSKKINSMINVELSETDKYQKISISDNGIGIDMDVASGKVFQMYQRFNDTHPGQGFGLFLVKSQMEAMGGKVELVSVLGQGSTFSLYFPKEAKPLS